MLLTITCMLPDALARLPVSFMTDQVPGNDLLTSGSHHK
jgi:hypothetical protein